MIVLEFGVFLGGHNGDWLVKLGRLNLPLGVRSGELVRENGGGNSNLPRVG